MCLPLSYTPHSPAQIRPLKKPSYTPTTLLSSLLRPCPACRFTNITRDFRGTLDYVLYTTDSLVPAAALELPDDSECRTKSHAGGWVGGIGVRGWVGKVGGQGVAVCRSVAFPVS